MWKGTTEFYVHNWNTELLKLCDELENGTYKPRKARLFTITEPKVREIMSINYRDRIYLRSLNDNAVYPQITKSFILDNYACQKGKGTDKARYRLRDFLYKFYRKYKLDGYYLAVDIKKFYPHMDRTMAKEIMANYLDETTHELLCKELDCHPGDIGFNPGDQTIQNVGISVLDKLDHYIKERLRIKFYLRYMDDFILIHQSKEYLEYCLSEIERLLAKQNMKLNDKKTFIKPISEKILFLGFTFQLTPSGKVVILANPTKIKHEKKKIKRMIRLVEKGKLTKREVDNHFKAFKVCIRFGNSHKLIENFNKWYLEQWRF